MMSVGLSARTDSKATVSLKAGAGFISRPSLANEKA